jgi:SAM-dependent methyltransferase
MKQPKCLICSGSPRYLITKDNFHHYVCEVCEHVFIHPAPTEQQLSDLYSPKSGYQKSKHKQANKYQPIHQTYNKVLNFSKEHRIATILDIGCSSGDFMLMAKNDDFIVEGIEPNSTTADAARSRGLIVHTGYLPEVTLQHTTFDLIYLGDVIEHVLDPIALVKEVSKFVSSDGYIAIVTPNNNCFWSMSTLHVSKLFKIPWSVATPPYHISIFSDTSLDILMQKYFGTLQTRSYNHLPKLSYEIGSTGVWKQWKEKKNIQTLCMVGMTAVFYPFIFYINYLTKKVRKKDMGMVSIYKKHEVK